MSKIDEILNSFYYSANNDDGGLGEGVIIATAKQAIKAELKTMLAEIEGDIAPLTYTHNEDETSTDIWKKHDRAVGYNFCTMDALNVIANKRKEWEL